jgi:hypothetical protein
MVKKVKAATLEALGENCIDDLDHPILTTSAHRWKTLT